MTEVDLDAPIDDSEIPDEAPPVDTGATPGPDDRGPEWEAEPADQEVE